MFKSIFNLTFLQECSKIGDVATEPEPPTSAM